MVSVAGMSDGFRGVSEDGGLATCGIEEAGKAGDAGPEGTDDDEDLWFHGWGWLGVKGFGDVVSSGGWKGVGCGLRELPDGFTAEFVEDLVEEVFGLVPEEGGIVPRDVIGACEAETAEEGGRPVTEGDIAF